MFSFSSCHPVLFYEAGAPPHDLLPDGNNSSFQLPRSYLHRSSSGQSLPLHHQVPEPIHPPYSSSSSSSCCDYLDFKAGPVRRVLSTGDLQGMNYPNPSHRVGRYSAEERKERIQRYRSKRNQRNFHKKITTLADSRPRVRGRFTRNEGMEIETETEAAAAAAAESANIVKLYSHDNHEEKERKRHNVDVDVDVDWRSHLQAALATEDEANSFYDEDLIASFADALSINLYS